MSRCVEAGRRAGTWCPSRDQSKSKASKAPISCASQRIGLNGFTSQCIVQKRERNLLIDLGSGTVAVIDFERAALAPAVRDLVRLETGVFSRSLAARDAFFAGYGRDLAPVEATALRAWAVLDALSALAWALAHDDTHLLEHARRILSFDDLGRHDGRDPEAAL